MKDLVIRRDSYVAFDPNDNVVAVEDTYDMAKLEARSSGTKSPIVMHSYELKRLKSS